MSKYGWFIMFVIVGALAGGTVGASFYIISISGAEAIGIMQTGRVGGIEVVDGKNISQNMDRRGSPQILVDRLQTTVLTQNIADNAGLPEFGLGLAGVQYGGKSKLRSRLISDGSLLEIRVKEKNPADAIKLAQSALSLAIDTDRAMLQMLRSLVKARISDLENEESVSTALRDELRSRAFRSFKGETSSQVDSVTLISAVQMEAKLQVLRDAIWSLRTASVYPMSRETEVFARPMIVQPIIKSWEIAAGLGSLAGVALAFAFGLALKRTPT